jgi:hypothetical protein
VFGTREFAKKEFHATEKAKKYRISHAWHIEEREKRKLVWGPHIFSSLLIYGKKHERSCI